MFFVLFYSMQNVLPKNMLQLFESPHVFTFTNVTIIDRQILTMIPVILISSKYV